MDPTSFDPTTLVTFIFRAPPEVRTVELLGSWDNFQIPYRMHHDRRRGTGFWSGCFKFENIILDGWNLHWSKPRSGGLRQGGTYWYYYRINYDTDSFDDRQPQTTKCPLLPGQKVNILDVPVELMEPITRCRSANADIIGSLADLGDRQTLDPGDKFALLNPPPISKVHSRSNSDFALKGRLENLLAPAAEEVVAPDSSPCSPRTKPTVVVPQALESRDCAVSSASSYHSEESELSDFDEREHHSRDGTSLSEEELPIFPYPNALGAGPLESLDALGAALFASSESSRRADVDRDTIRRSLSEHGVRRASDYSLGPASIHNVQFYGSRPGTSLTEDPEQHRPRMYSLPNLEIANDTDDSPPESPYPYYSPQSNDPDETFTPGDELGNYDLVSPTFSAATISTGGHTTPFRLSVIGGTYIPTGRSEDQNIEDVAARLRALEPPSPRPRLKPTNFVNYSLPTIASASTHSLAKTITQPSAPPEEIFALPPSIFTAEEGTTTTSSIADDIFQELGFLSGSIA